MDRIVWWAQRNRVYIAIGFFLGILVVIGWGFQCEATRDYRIAMGSIDTDLSSFVEGSYRGFTGRRLVNIGQLEIGDKITFQKTVSTQQGDFRAKLEGRDFVETIEDGKSINVPRDGTYFVVVYGDEHRGSFQITWQIE